MVADTADAYRSLSFPLVILPCWVGSLWAQGFRSYGSLKFLLWGEPVSSVGIRPGGVHGENGWRGGAGYGKAYRVLRYRDP